MVSDRVYAVSIVVCGGRDNPDREGVFRYLDFLAEWVYGDMMIMHGNARGIDTYAEQWAKSREHLYVGVPAQWGKYGKKAGTKRNSEMAAISKAEAVVVFRGGRGTLNMLSLARNMDEQPTILLPDGEFWK